MQNPRETIYAAAFAVINGLLGATVIDTAIQTVSRKLVPPDQCPVPQQPAIYFCQTEEDPIVVAMSAPAPNKWKLMCKLYVYVYQDSAVGPAPYLNTTLDLIENIMKAPKTGVGKHQLTQFPMNQPAVPLVEDFRIAGKVVTDEGWLGSQAIAVVPLQIITA